MVLHAGEQNTIYTQASILVQVGDNVFISYVNPCSHHLSLTMAPSLWIWTSTKKFGHHYFLHSPRIAVRFCWMIKAVRQRNPWLIAKRYDSKEKVRKGSQDSATEAEILKENEDVSFPNWILEAARLETKAADFPQWIPCLRLTDILIQTVSVLGPTAHIHANTKAP